jgi:hypothetical protein
LLKKAHFVCVIIVGKKLKGAAAELHLPKCALGDFHLAMKNNVEKSTLEV